MFRKVTIILLLPIVYILVFSLLGKEAFLSQTVHKKDEGRTKEGYAENNIPLFVNLVWSEDGERLIRYGAGLLLRSETQTGDTLLIKHSEHNAVYLYDPASQSLILTSEDVWQHANGTIEQCESQIPPSPLILRLDATSDTLFAGGRKVLTAGKSVLRVLQSPSGKKVVVLSAEGSRSESFLPFLGRGGASGQHYHQVFSLPDILPIGKTLSLPLGSQEEDILMCWSFDERYIVYTDIYFTRLAIVNLN